MLMIFTTTIRVKNKYNANMIVIIFVGKMYNLISGKESTEVRITQNKGKERENLPKIEEITVGMSHANTQKLNRNISTVTAVFLNQKRMIVCEHMTQIASLVSF